MCVPGKRMAGSLATSRAGTRSPRPTASSASTAGTGKAWKPAACSPGKTAEISWPSTPPKSASPYRPVGSVVVREGHGTGEGRGSSPGEVHDIALKAAETDATKRALATFGSPFGLDLYGNGRALSRKPLPSASNAEPAERPLGLHPDDTTPIPRPSRYYGDREGPPVDESLRNERRKAEREAAPPLAPAPPEGPGRIDKSLLTLGEPKRIRDKEHLKFVASQPCLLCGRQPSDAHHLRFAQPRAIGMKVSDEFTVPLCRIHHRQLHDAGNEVAWWEDLDINALEIAKGLWEERRGKGKSEVPVAITNEDNKITKRQ